MAMPSYRPHDSLEGWSEARSSLPRGARVAYQRGLHVLYRLTPAWFILLGPDDGADLPWVGPFLAVEGDWTASFETFAQTLLTHFLA